MAKQKPNESCIQLASRMRELAEIAAINVDTYEACFYYQEALYDPDLQAAAERAIIAKLEIAEHFGTNPVYEFDSVVNRVHDADVARSISKQQKYKQEQHAEHPTCEDDYSDDDQQDDPANDDITNNLDTDGDFSDGPHHAVHDDSQHDDIQEDFDDAQQDNMQHDDVNDNQYYDDSQDNQDSSDSFEQQHHHESSYDDSHHFNDQPLEPLHQEAIT
jgi:hypothetical protein